MNRKERRARKAAGQASPDVQGLIGAAREQAASGNHIAAEEQFRAVLAQAPRDAECLFYYGTFLIDQGRHTEAERLLKGAARTRPTSVPVWANLAACQIALGDRKSAAKSAAKALGLAPGDEALRNLLHETVANRPLDADETAAMSFLPSVVDAPGTAPAALLEPVISAFAVGREAGRLMMAGPMEGDGEACCRAIAACAPLMALLPMTLINDTALEAVLTAARRHLLLSADRDAEWFLPLASALARHCFLAEFVYEETPEEQAAVAALINSGALKDEDLCAIGCYRAVSGQAGDRPLGPDAGAVVTLQVTAPAERRRIAQEIPALTPMRDDISSAVRDQYEDHPYPRWIAPMIAATARPVEGYLNDAPGVAPISLPGLPKHPRVLVAGCGTGRHAIYVASALAGAEILAIDLSRASLAYARQKADELGIENLRFAQADILELGRIDDRFDVIESSGVLHHMADPLAGWRVLVDLLNPGGVMKVGLYSESGRAGERRAQAIVKDRGLRPDVEGIRRMRAEVKALASAGDETLRLLTKALAFYSASECRDLVFHVMEHRFTIPEIEAALTALNLDFLGFHLPHPGYLAAVRAAQGPDVDVRSLAPWHEFERDNPLAFIGMYQFWCRKPET